MKKTAIILAIMLGASAAAGVFFFHSRPVSEQEFRANLTDAQKVLVMLRRAETARRQSSKSYEAVFAKKSGGKMIYSKGWNAMKLPEVEVSTGFDYECLPAEEACQAMEVGKTGPSGNGIRIDIETGDYSCLGAYSPVTTEGFDGTLVTVACRA